jgi:hypothetical protein
MPHDEIVAAAVRALRRRAERQRSVAESWTARGERGVTIRQGEAAIALRIAAALEAAADEIERGPL